MHARLPMRSQDDKNMAIRLEGIYLIAQVLVMISVYLRLHSHSSYRKVVGPRRSTVLAAHKPLGPILLAIHFGEPITNAQLI